MASGQKASIDVLLQAFHDQAHDHVLLLFDPDEIIVWASPAAERILGCPADTLVGHATSDLFTPEDRELGVPAHEFTIAREHGSAEDDRWMQRLDGSRFWAAGLAYALRDPQGELMGYGKILRNRTDFKEQQEAFRNRISDLARTDEQRNRMIVTFAHEMRNPLSPLSNAVHLLRSGAPVDYPIKLIERQVDFMRRLVDDLMDATRVHTGKVQLRLEPLVLQDVINAAADTVRTLADSQSQQLSLLLPPADIRVQGDPIRLQQVFVNLLTNACKYTLRGGRIWVKLTPEGSEAVVRVEDTGIGIAPHMLAHIFELFAQVHTPSTPDGGVGIGLALVKELVTLHGGTVQANSDGIGKGSDFIVRLPLAGGAVSSGPAADSPSS